MMKDSEPAAPVPPRPSPLTPKERRALRARAHALKPVVRIAATGPTEGMLRELDRALTAHELVKIHAAIDDREERSRLLEMLCRKLGAEPVQAIGKMLIAFRARPDVVQSGQPSGAARASAGAHKPGSGHAGQNRKRSAAARPARAPMGSKTARPARTAAAARRGQADGSRRKAPGSRRAAARR